MNNRGGREGAWSSKNAEPTAHNKHPKTNSARWGVTCSARGRVLLSFLIEPEVKIVVQKASSSAGCEAGCIGIAGNAAWIDRPWKGYEGERSEPE